MFSFDQQTAHKLTDTGANLRCMISTYCWVLFHPHIWEWARRTLTVRKKSGLTSVELWSACEGFQPRGSWLILVLNEGNWTCWRIPETFQLLQWRALESLRWFVCRGAELLRTHVARMHERAMSSCGSRRSLCKVHCEDGAYLMGQWTKRSWWMQQKLANQDGSKNVSKTNFFANASHMKKRRSRLNWWRQIHVHNTNRPIKMSCSHHFLNFRVHGRPL